MSSIPCDIVLLPNPGLKELAIKTSQDLHGLGSYFVLNKNSPVPHASIFMVQLRSKDLAKIGDQLIEIALTTNGFDLVSTDYVQAEGWIDANYQKPKELDELQMLIVNTLNPQRDGLYKHKDELIKSMSGLARENLIKYGDHRVGELFRPHLTFTRFEQENPIDTSKHLPEPSTFSGLYDRLGLFEVGPHGTCIREIMTFPLLSS